MCKKKSCYLSPTVLFSHTLKCGTTVARRAKGISIIKLSGRGIGGAHAQIRFLHFPDADLSSSALPQRGNTRILFTFNPPAQERMRQQISSLTGGEDPSRLDCPRFQRCSGAFLKHFFSQDDDAAPRFGFDFLPLVAD